MTTQLLLPILPPFPATHLRWLETANAAEYFDKHAVFYPLKSRLLRRFAVPDGYDVQTIKKPCWCGDGVWRGIDDQLPRALWERCHKCSGTGIYSNRQIALRRWLLNGTLFHEPAPEVFIEDISPAEHINGLIKHSPTSSTAGNRAMLRLLLRYEPRRWLQVQYGNLKRAVFWKVKIPTINRIRVIRRKLFPSQTDDIPF